jgi:hypothetical protein
VLRPIPQWVIAIGAPVMVLIAVAAVWLLLGFGISGDRLDAIRTGGTLGVGLGGVVVLWLAVRRQRSTELDLLNKYEAHRLAERVAAHNEAVATDNRTHQQQVAQAAQDDAAERRITELYAKAADQLGSDKAPVRLAGLYALERLAQDTPRLRPTIVNVICAYLRMPYTVTPPTASVPRPLGRRRRVRPGHPIPPATQAAAVHQPDPVDTARQEREVRLTAQAILTTHLHPGGDLDHPAETFWDRINLDLTGATLINFSLDQCVVEAATFTLATFTGLARFGSATFDGRANFDLATFNNSANFDSATFNNSANFQSATFTGLTSFDSATFASSANFYSARFDGVTSFGSATFTGSASFQLATFTGSANFQSATFSRGTPHEVKQSMSLSSQGGDADGPGAPEESTTGS